MGWFKRSKRPSDYELTSKIASVIDAFIDQEGLSEFSSDRLSVVVTSDYRVAISSARFVRDSLIAVPLNDLKLEQVAVLADEKMRHMAVDFVARSVALRIPK